MLLRRFFKATVFVLLSSGAIAQEAVTVDADTEGLLSRFSDDPDRFTQTEGEALYRTTCQACHMENGEGDAGAGAYPPLTGDNPKMNSRHFIAGVILNGYHAMPRFDAAMTDEQIAAVTNYVRTSFGNNFPEIMTAEEVKALRAPE